MSLSEIPPGIVLGSTRSRTHVGCPICGIELHRGWYAKHVEADLAQLRAKKFPKRGKLTDAYWILAFPD